LAEELLSLVGSGQVEYLLRRRLEGSGFFGARFRECAARSLLLPKGKFNQRMPLWLTRLRSQRLLEAVKRYEDFPILLETWRTCIQDEFDLESLKQVLEELERGSITWTETHTPAPSPFAQSEWWHQVNQYMYMDDSLKPDKRSRLRESLLKEVVFTPGLRPTVSRKVVEEFELKRQRLSPGYSPQTARELFDWVIERVAIPINEWEDLLEAIRRDHDVDPESLLDSIKERLIKLRPPKAEAPLVAVREILPQVKAMYGHGKPVPIESLTLLPLSAEYEDLRNDLEGPETSIELLGQWLQFYGPVTIESIQKKLGMERERLQLAMDDLIDSQKVIRGQLVTEGSPEEVCDSENFEILLRNARIRAIPSFEPLDIEWLPLFLADYQGITKAEEGPQDGIEGVHHCLEKLVCYPTEAELWELEIFPARLHPYDPSWLDSLMQEGNLLWLGSEGHHITFCFKSDIDLLKEDSAGGPYSGSDEVERLGNQTSQASEQPLSHLFRDEGAGYDFFALLKASQTSESELTEGLWEEVWQGRITNDTFMALRRAIMKKFDLQQMLIKNIKRRSRRVSRRRRLSLVEEREAPVFVGNWHLIPRKELLDDLLENEERRKDRVRLLLDRYGILFRELLQREWPTFRWPAVFRALRIMELSGEVMSGVFFHGISGPQFISPKAFRRLQRKLPKEAIYWINAADPASLCGVQTGSLRGILPPRVAGTHLVYRGKDLKVISKRNGKDLSFLIPHHDPDLPNYFISLHHLLTRKFQPLKRIIIETINGEKAIESPYIEALRSIFVVSVDPKEVVLFKKIRDTSHFSGEA
jgi:ATP-dependent Lhr-like helicase